MINSRGSNRKASISPFSGYLTPQLQLVIHFYAFLLEKTSSRPVRGIFLLTQGCHLVTTVGIRYRKLPLVHGACHANLGPDLDPQDPHEGWIISVLRWGKAGISPELDTQPVWLSW